MAQFKSFLTFPAYLSSFLFSLMTFKTDFRYFPYNYMKRGAVL